MRESLRLENEGGSLSQWNKQVARSDGGRGGGGSHAACLSFFPCPNMNNVNGQLYWAQSLLALWEVLEYKGRTGGRHAILHKIEERSVLRIMPTSCRSRPVRADNTKNRI